MAAIAVVMVGVGAFLLYEAVKSPHPTPLKRAVAAAKGG